MKSSSPPSSSSSSSSVSSTSDTQLLSSPSPPPCPPRLSLRSPELQAEFLQECWNKFPSDRDVAESSGVASATSPPSPLPSPSSSSSSSSSSPSCYDSRRARLSLSSPELLSELRQSRTRSLRRVPAQNGLTTVFCGRGRRGRGVEAPDSASSTPSANQKASH